MIKKIALASIFAALFLFTGSLSAGESWPELSHYDWAHMELEQLEVLLQSVDVDARDDNGSGALFHLLQWGAGPGINNLFNQILDHGLDLEAAVEDDRDLLELAILHDFVEPEIVDFIIDAGAEINDFDYYNEYTPLHFAAMKSTADRNLVPLMLERGADPNLASPEDGSTPLMFSVGRPSTAFQDLLNAGARIDTRDRDGNTVLFHAAKSTGSTRRILALLDMGIDPLERNDKGETALFNAMRNPEFSELCLQALLDAGISIDAFDDEGRTALFTVLLDGFQHVSARENMDFLLKYGADPNARDVNGMTPLTAIFDRLIFEEQLELMQLFIDNGADVNTKDDRGVSVLTTSLTTYSMNRQFMDHRRISAVEILLQSGALATTADLYWAVESGVAFLIPDIILAGADPSPESGPSLMLSISHGTYSDDRREIFLDLVRQGASLRDWDAGSQAVLRHCAGLISRAETLSDPGKGNWIVDELDKNGRTALMLAVVYGADPEIISFLLDAGADVDALDNDGLSPLLHAAIIGAPESTMSELLEKIGGNSLKLTSWWGKTILHLAVIYGNNPETVTALIRAGADVNGEDDDGSTVINSCIQLNSSENLDLEIVQALLESGAEISQEDLHMAFEYCDLSLVETLIEDMNESVQNIDFNVILLSLVGDDPQIIAKVERLVELGADLGAQSSDYDDDYDYYGEPLWYKALRYTSVENGMELWEYMLVSGVDIYTEDDYGLTVIDYAKSEKEYWSFVPVLENLAGGQ